MPSLKGCLFSLLPPSHKASSDWSSQPNGLMPSLPCWQPPRPPTPNPRSAAEANYSKAANALPQEMGWDVQRLQEAISEGIHKAARCKRL